MELTCILFRYEMYAEDSRAPSVAHHKDDVDGGYPVESGPAIEVIELANGETVWYVFHHMSQRHFRYSRKTYSGRLSMVSGATTTNPSTEIGRASLPSIHSGTDQTTAFN